MAWPNLDMGRVVNVSRPQGALFLGNGLTVLKLGGRVWLGPT